MAEGLKSIKRALISVSDKTGLEDLARALAGHGVEIVSTGGTARAIADWGVPVRDVAELTGWPEMLDGRVKTLHPRVHGGLLAIRDNAEHRAAIAEHGIPEIDLLVVNLYPFEETVARGASFDETIENIDIGGPAMIRAAAKNHHDVAVVVDVEDYARILGELSHHEGQTCEKFRKKLALTAYARTAAYDSAIANWLADQLHEARPRYFTIGGKLAQSLRYGENPHQSAALYRNDPTYKGVANALQLQGKELSYNNINDTDAAFELVAEFGATRPAVAIIKHANPCGVAQGTTLADAYRAALACDPVSAFGGIIAVNQELDAATAEEIAKIFTEVIIAPSASAEAQAIIAAKKNLRLLVTDGLPNPAKRHGASVRALGGGLLVQGWDAGSVGPGDVKVVTKRAPSDDELKDLLFAFTVAKHVKSNAIVYAKAGATVGIGAGQMSRLDSARIAAIKAQDAAKAAGAAVPATIGSVVASDAFFPFADGLIAAAEAGVTAVIQPGGSVRDEEVIAAADARGLAMVFTGVRHFRH